MQAPPLRPFETIESALEFMVLLESAIQQSSEELDTILAASTAERYGNGVRLALYKIGQLSTHVAKSRRILNDLTLIRNILVNQPEPPSQP